jgi:hypothetical protein
MFLGECEMSTITLVGVITQRRKLVTNNKKIMETIQINHEDTDIVVFPRSYQHWIAEIDFIEWTKQATAFVCTPDNSRGFLQYILEDIQQYTPPTEDENTF